jgi:hypothetical protein
MCFDISTTEDDKAEQRGKREASELNGVLSAIPLVRSMTKEELEMAKAYAKALHEKHLYGHSR